MTTNQNKLKMAELLIDALDENRLAIVEVPNGDWETFSVSEKKVKEQTDKIRELEAKYYNALEVLSGHNKTIERLRKEKTELKEEIERLKEQANGI